MSRETGVHRTEAQIIIDQVNIAEMYEQGIPTHEISEKLNLSRTTIYKDLKKIKSDWIEKRGSAYEGYIAKALASYDKVEDKAWDAWEKSLENGVTVKEDSFGIATTTKNNSGNPTYLDIILKISKQRAELLGLEAPTKTITVTHEMSDKEAFDKAASVLKEI